MKLSVQETVLHKPEKSGKSKIVVYGGTVREYIEETESLLKREGFDVIQSATVKGKGGYVKYFNHKINENVIIDVTEVK